MVLSQPLESPDGKMVLGQGTVLNNFLISCLARWAVEGVDVSEAESGDFSLDDIEKMVADVMQGLAHKAPTVKRDKTLTVQQNEIEIELKRIFLLTRYHGALPLDNVLTLANEKIYPMLSWPEAFAMLHSDAPAGDYLYRHALDVALVAGFLGRWLGYDDISIAGLVLAGLLHDIGKARIKFEILSKPGRLDREEFNIAKTHAGKSRQLVEQAGNVPDAVLNAILQHHERLDGSGYPDGLKGEAILPLSRIIAVADVYDALISNRCYRKGVSPLEAIDIMLYHMPWQLDTHVLACLIERVRQLEAYAAG